TVIIAFAVGRVISFFAAPQRLETKILIPGIGVEFSDAKSSEVEARHCSPQVRSATFFHLHGLIGDGIRLRVGENPRRCWFASGTDRIARSNANRAGCVCV